MRIRVLSDLHEEHRHRVGGTLELPAVPADVTVLAGDLDNGLQVLEVALRPCFQGSAKIVVPGNHEFYEAELEPMRRALRAAFARAMEDPAVRAGGGVHLLDDDVLVLGGTRFVGGTLWTDFMLDGEAARQAAIEGATRRAADHHLIRREGGLPFLPEDSMRLHGRTRALLARTLATPFDGPTVVVTHHAPHPGSVATRFVGNAVNPAFVNDLGELMGPAALWIHGHTHDGFDYDVNGTRVLANPAGYRRRAAPGAADAKAGGFVFENPLFDPALVVEV